MHTCSSPELSEKRTEVMRQALSHVEHAPFKLARKKEDKCRKQIKKNSKGEKEEFFFLSTLCTICHCKAQPKKKFSFAPDK